MPTIFAVDTNVLLDVLIPDAAFARASLGCLQAAAAEGRLVLCEMVYTELSCHFPHRADLQHFLADAGLTLLPSYAETLHAAGRAWKRFLDARKGTPTPPPKRPVADFLVGAHAMRQADRLISRDRGFYRSFFQNLLLLDPSAP